MKWLLKIGLVVSVLISLSACSMFEKEEEVLFDFLGGDWNLLKSDYEINPALKLTYRQDYEESTSYTTEDPELIKEIFDALQTVTVGEIVDERALDQGQVLIFEFKSSREYTMYFEADRVLRDRMPYRIHGFEKVQALLDQLAGQ